MPDIASSSLHDAPSGAEPARQPPSSWAVFAVALAATTFCTTEFLPVGLLRYLSAGLDISAGVAGLTVTAPGLLAAVAAPLVAVLSGRIDRRRVLLALAALLFVSNVLAMAAPNFATLEVARALFGVGLGGFWAVGAGIGSRLVPPERAARATAVIFAGVSIGMLIGGSAGAFIAEHWGWRSAFGFSSVLALAGFAAQWLSLPRLPVAKSMPASDLLGIVRSPAGRRGLLTMALVLCAQFAAYTYVTPFLAQRAHFDALAISALLLLYTLVGLAGTFLAGQTAGRHARATLAAAAATFVASTLILPFAAGYTAATIALLVAWGIAYGALPLALQVLMSQAAPDVPEGGMALYVANFQISIALGSFIGGWFVDHAGLSNALTDSGWIAIAGLLLLFAPAGRSSRLVTEAG